jgi:hypothetical protein
LPTDELQLTVQTPILSRGILFTTHFAFGILALVGCLVIQCLLVTWFALLAAQVKSMNLQARMFEYVYGLSIENAQAERKKRKNVVRIESKLLLHEQGLESGIFADKLQSHHHQARMDRSRRSSRKRSLSMSTSRSTSGHPCLT